MQVVVAGDFNIAPTDADVWNTTYWKDKILVSVPERSALTALKGAGLNDAWEIGLHAPDTFSWWDYRQSGFEKNHGLRIDLMLGSASLLKRVTDVTIDTAPRAAETPRDHAPVVMTLLLPARSCFCETIFFNFVVTKNGLMYYPGSPRQTFRNTDVHRRCRLQGTAAPRQLARLLLSYSCDKTERGRPLILGRRKLSLRISVIPLRLPSLKREAEFQGESP